ncbi:hypothetical protein AB4037_25540 [Labrys sp. KB_33_2]
MANALAEVVKIQKFADAGRTKGEYLYMMVNGRDVCGYCEKDIARAATAAGLEGIVIYETATGHTKYWRSGMKAIRRVRGIAQ